MGWEAQVWTAEEEPAVAPLSGSPRHVQSPGYSPPCAHSLSHLQGWATVGTDGLTRATASTSALTQAQKLSRVVNQLRFNTEENVQLQR